MTADLSTSDPVDLAREPEFEIGGAKVRPAVREIGEGAARETLEPRVMRVLVMLARHAGQVVSRDALVQACWDGRIVGDDAINVCVSKVRRAGDAHSAFKVETIPRVGYRLTAVIPPPDSASQARRWTWAAVVIAALAVGAAVWFAADRLAPPSVEDARIAVLPFETLTNDPDAMAFARTADVRIEGALQEARLQTTDRPRAAVLTLEGSVSGSPKGLVVRVSLIEPRSELVIWTTEFERPRNGVDSLANDIARRSATTIDIALEAMAEGGRSLDPQTLALYVKARDNAGLADVGALGGMALAVQRSPDFALARGWRAQGRLPPATFLAPADFEAQRAQAVVEAREALRRDPDLAIAHVAQAQAMYGLRWAEREASLRRSLTGRLEPEQAFLISFLLSVGRVDEAARIGRALAAAHRTWPLAAPIVDRAIYLAGAPEEAAAYLRRDMAARPNDVLLQTTMLEVSALSDAYEEAERILADPPTGTAALNPGTVEAFRAFLTAKRSGAAADRARAIETIMGAASSRRLLRAHAIPMLNDLGAVDEAFRLAEVYLQDPIPFRMGHASTTYLFFGPDTAPMRRDPRFIPLMRRLRLIDYWRSSGVWPDFCENEPQSVCAEMKREAEAPA